MDGTAKAKNLANPKDMTVLFAVYLAENVKLIIATMKSLKSEEVLVCHVYSIMVHLESILVSQCLPEQQAFGVKNDTLLRHYEL